MRPFAHFALAAVLLLALAGTASAADAPTQEEELALAYGDQPMVSIATGRQQALSRAPAVATVITAQEIAATGAIDLDQALESVPGLHVSYSSLVNNPLYVIRGIASQYNPHVLMLVNGIPITTPFLGNRGFPWGGFPLEHVARIEVIRGPGSALYGADAFSGVINIITKTAADIRGTELGARLGSFDTRDGWLQHGASHGKVDVALFLRAGHTDGHERLVEQDLQGLMPPAVSDPSLSFAPGPLSTARDAADARLSLGYQHWRLRASYHTRESGLGAGLAESLDPYGRLPATRRSADLSYQAPLSPEWELNGQVAYFDNREHPAKPYYLLFPPGAFGTDPGTGAPYFPDGIIGNPSHSERRTHASLTTVFSGLERHQLRFGTGYHLDDLYRTRETKNYTVVLGPLGQPQFQPLPGGLQEVSDDPSQVFLTPHRRELLYVLAQDEWSLGQDWTLTTGVRYDHHSDFGDTTNPRLALVWDAAYNLVVKALYGQAFRAPSFAEQYNLNNPVALGNPALQPETIETSELAFVWQPTGALQTNLTLFHYHMQDIIRFTPNASAGGATAANTGEQTGRGLELEAGWQASPTLRLSGNLSLQRTIDEASGQEAGLAPGVRLFSRVDWRPAPLWQLGATANHVADRERQPGDARPPVDDYTTVDFSLRREQVLGRGELRATLFNAFAADAREPSLAPGNIPLDLPLAGRAFYVQFQYRL